MRTEHHVGFYNVLYIPKGAAKAARLDSVFQIPITFLDAAYLLLCGRTLSQLASPTAITSTFRGLSLSQSYVNTVWNYWLHAGKLWCGRH